MGQLFRSERLLGRNCAWYVTLALIAAFVAAGWAAEQKTETKPAKTPPTAKPIAEPASSTEDEPKAPDLGPPLVDDAKALRRLDPDAPVWLDLPHKQVVFMGTVCAAGYPLEFFVTYANRSYEAVVSSEVKPSIVHAGLLAVGAKPGKPAQFQPKFIPPSGTEIAIEVRWKDAQGKIHSAAAQDWVRDVKTKKALKMAWVFAGSRTVADETTGENHYQADSGDFICLLNLPSAMLDLPIRSESSLESRLFEAFRERLPPTETPVTLLLKPKLAAPGKKLPEATTKAKPKIVSEEAEEEEMGIRKPDAPKSPAN